MMWILTNWRLISAALAGAAIALFATFIYVTILNGNHQREMLAQKEVLTAQCQTAQDKTKEQQNEIQSAYNDVASKLDAANRLLKVKPVCHTLKPASASASGGGSMDNLGLSEAWLNIQFANCSRLWHERIVLEEACK